jgi:putative FmdB family regulatory protein
MPIYAYRCASCGHTKDVLQKLSEAPLSVCPACGQSTFSKSLTAPAFQLKGSGWYVTDFRDNGKKPAASGEASSPPAPDAKAPPESSNAASPTTPAPASSPAPAPAPAPAAAPPSAS